MSEKTGDLIKQYVAKYAKIKGTRTKWQEPLVAYADADDQMFSVLKEVVGPTHALPRDFLPGAKTVIAYFLPFEKQVVESNSEGREASRDWAVAYIETNRLILDLNTYLKAQLGRFGFNSAVIPATHNFDRKQLISDWSHRHVAFIAGLGTFGLNRMLITEKGCCGRVGSLVTDANMEPTRRTNGEFCLFKKKGKCTRCAKRCVNGALQVDGYDRHKCYEMCLHNDKAFPDLELTDICGKCLVNVPCSITVPGGG